MHRNLAAALTWLCLLAPAGSASASATLDLIWADTATPTITVLPSDPGATAGGDICSTGFLSGAGVGRCLIVRITTTLNLWHGALSSIGWDGATSGLGVDAGHALRPGFKAFGGFGANGANLGPAFPSFLPAVVPECQAIDPSCDTAFGSFGGVTPVSSNAPGTYTLGSINYDTSSVVANSWTQITHFFRSGVDGVIDSKFVSVPAQLNGATLHVVPEPGTAGLLSLGVVALVLAGRRRS